MKSKILLLIGAALCGFFTAVAPVLAQGTAFTYQGRLSQGGSPAGGNYDLSFTIYDALTNGNIVGGPLTNSPVSVSNGLFTVTLDFGVGVFTGAERWLEIAARTNGGGGAFDTLAPRQPLTSTPYALRAATAGSAAAVSGLVAASQLAGTISSNNIASGTITATMLANGSVTTASLADGAVNLAKLSTAYIGVVTTTFTNPTPAGADYFGWSVAAVGSDRVLIGAPYDDAGATDSGAAYLFNTNGALLTTFLNPTPAGGDFFGWSAAAVGSDRVLIGAPYDDTGAMDAGAAYLFRTNGALQTVFTNPAPAASEFFGISVAAIGSDKVLIGASGGPGAAYLFRTNGALITTFTNPTPAGADLFGFSVAAVGLDTVVIGAYGAGISNAGAAYLFRTNGALLTTFLNPTPAGGDSFGISVAAVGSDKVLIGAPYDDTGATDAGSAYLFSISGALLATFRNPAPANGDQFGWSVAAAGSDRVLIGAIGDDMVATDAGAAYLFNIDGTLLATFTDPTPSANESLGNSVAALGSDKLLVGIRLGGATGAGEALLFSLGAPHVLGLMSQGVLDGAITTASLANDAVVSSKIASGAIGTAQLSAGSVTTATLADGAVNLAKLNLAVNSLLSTTFTNPTPAVADNFGISVAGVGAGKVIIGAYQDDTGAPNAGAAYLLTTSGTLLLTLTNPSPAANEFFGISVAGMGSDRVLIGAAGDNTGAAAAGAAYLFGVSGSLLTTFTNPAPAIADYFGYSVAAVGSDKVLIGAPYDDTGATDAGAAYLFSTNGMLLTTFLNPTPAGGDSFGFCVAAVGSDKVLVGAYQDGTGAPNAGAAYLFSTSGTLLITFTNPTPANADNFGSSVAAVGSDKVLIGAPNDDTGATDAGAAYLFSISGALLTTFTNPTPANGDNFGWSVAGVGSDKVLIGAYQDDTGATDAGAAYLFSTSGALLTTFTNPTPASGDNFGWSVAAVGSDKVLIGAYQDDTGATDAGAAYLFSLESYFPGLISQGVVDGSITTASLADGAITEGKLANGAVTDAKIANVDASKITSGTISTNIIANGSISSVMLADGAVNLAKLNTSLASVASTIFSNPTPASGDNFSYSVAAVGSDKVLIGTPGDDTGATDAGAAYLFSTSGALLTTFTNPTPASGDNFGYSVAAVGSDKVLIGTPGDDTGATDAGAAYLFSTNGALLTAFLNPTPASGDKFGYSVAAVGSDKVLVGAYQDGTGAPNAGAAYLFSSSGTLLTTFTNPTPVSDDNFGNSVAAVGSDKVLIGAYRDDTGAPNAGAAYLFSTNGALLTTFTNPTPVSGDIFGNSVAAVGSDKVLIGTPGDDTGATDAGAAYLFSTNGTLLTTFTNPAPTSSDLFGYSVAAVSSDKVLIGAFLSDMGGTDAGAAYLFSTSGVLLSTFTNPTPGSHFGLSVTAVGSDKVLIGANGNGTGGAAYLFRLGSYMPGLISEEVLDGSITDAKIANVDAAKITSGTLSDARLSANVALRAGGNAFTGQQTVSGGNVGIGTPSPGYPLHVFSTSLPTALVDGSSTFGTWNVLRNTAGGTNWHLISTGSGNGEGPGKLLFSRGSDPGSSLGTVLTLQPNGMVGIGTSAPGDLLEVNGAIRGTGFRCRPGTAGSANLINVFNFQWTGSSLQAWIDGVNVGAVSLVSDRRLKENIQPLPGRALARVMALKPAAFKYKDVDGSIFKGDGETKEGFIADELQRVIPSAVSGAPDAVTESGQIQPQRVNVLPLVAVLTQAIQEQQTQIQARQAENTELKRKNSSLEKRLEALEQIVGKERQP